MARRGLKPGVAQKVRRRSGESTPDTPPAAVQAAAEHPSCKRVVPGSSPGPGLEPTTEETKERLDNMRRITGAAMRDALTCGAFADAALYMGQAAQELLNRGQTFSAASVLSCMRSLHTDYLRYRVSHEPGGREHDVALRTSSAQGEEPK
jgi:hypothetical protein